MIIPDARHGTIIHSSCHAGKRSPHERRTIFDALRGLWPEFVLPGDPYAVCNSGRDGVYLHNWDTLCLPGTERASL
jgi:hypothetical protein